MKTAYLVLRQYSRFFLRELCIMAQICFLIFSITRCVAPVSYSLATSNAARQSIRQNALYVGTFPRVDNILRNPIEYTNSDRQQITALLEEGISSAEGVVGQGMMSSGMLHLGEDPDAPYSNALFYNDDLIRYTELPLSEGEWLPTGYTEGSAIPIVLGGPMKDQYDIGQKISGDISTFAGEEPELVQMVVVGKLAYGDLYFDFSAGADIPDLEVLARRNGATSMGAGGENIIIAPASCIDSVYQNPYFSHLLFLEENQDASRTAQKLREQYGEYGIYHSLSEIFENQTQRDLANVNTYVILSGVLLLLCIFGLGGYTLLTLSKSESIMGIYYQCGMKKSRMAAITILSNFFLLLIPTVLMSCLSGYIVDERSTVNVYTYLASVAVVLVVFLSTCILSIVRASRLDPIQMIRKERD